MKNFKLLLLVSLISISPALYAEPVEADVTPAVTDGDPKQPSQEEIIEHNETENDYNDLDAQRGDRNFGEQSTQAPRRWWQFWKRGSTAKAPETMVGTDAGTTSSIGVDGGNKSPMTIQEAERGLTLGQLNNKVFRGKDVTYDGDGQVGFQDNLLNNNGKRGVLETWADRFNDYWGGGKTRKEIYALSAEAENLKNGLKKTDLTKDEYDDKIKKLNSVVKELEARRINMQSTKEIVNGHMQRIRDGLNNLTKHTTDGLKRQIKNGVEGLRQYVKAGTDGIKAGVYTPDADTLERLSNLATRVSTREGQSKTLTDITTGIDSLKKGATDTYDSLRDHVNQWATPDLSKKDRDALLLIMDSRAYDRMDAQRIKEENGLATTLLVKKPSKGLMNHASIESLREAQDIASSEGNQENADTLRKAQESRVKSSLKDLDSLRNNFMEKAKSYSLVQRLDVLDDHFSSYLNPTGLDPKKEKEKLEKIKATYKKDPPTWYTAKSENGESLQKRVNSWINSLLVADRVQDLSGKDNEGKLEAIEDRLRRGEYTTEQQKYDLLLLQKRLESRSTLNNDRRFKKIKTAMNSSEYKNGTLRVDQWGDIDAQRKRLERNVSRFGQQIEDPQKELDNFNALVEKERPARERPELDKRAAEQARQTEVEKLQREQNEKAARKQEEYHRQQQEQDEANRRAAEQSKGELTETVRGFNKQFEAINRNDGEFETKDKALRLLKGKLERFLSDNSGQLKEQETDQIKHLLKNVTLDVLENDFVMIERDEIDRYTVVRIGSLMEQINTADANPLLKGNPKLKELYTKARKYALQNNIDLTGKKYLRPDWLSESEPQPAQSDPNFVQSSGVEKLYGGSKAENFKEWQKKQPRYQQKQSAAEQARIEEELKKAERARIEARNNLLVDQLSGEKPWSEDPEPQDNTVSDDDTSSLGGKSETSVGSGGNSPTDVQKDMLNQISDMTPEQVQQESSYNLDKDTGRLGMDIRTQRKNVSDWNKTLGRAEKYQRKGRSLDDLKEKDYYKGLTDQQKTRIDELYQRYTDGKRKKRGNIRNMRDLYRDTRGTRVKRDTVNY